jgi:hypothetical protein
MIWIFETVRHYYHKVQGKQDEHEVGAEELVYQMIQQSINPWTAKTGTPSSGPQTFAIANNQQVQTSQATVF